MSWPGNLRPVVTPDMVRDTRWRESAELEDPETDVADSFVVDAVGLIPVLYQLIDGEHGIVRLSKGVRNLVGGT